MIKACNYYSSELCSPFVSFFVKLIICSFYKSTQENTEKMAILDLYGKQDGKCIKFDLNGNQVSLENYTTINVNVLWIEWRSPKSNTPFALETNIINFGDDAVKQLVFGCTSEKATTTMVCPVNIQEEKIRLRCFENANFQVLCPFSRRVLPIKRIYLQLNLC